MVSSLSFRAKATSSAVDQNISEALVLARLPQALLPARHAGGESATGSLPPETVLPRGILFPSAGDPGISAAKVSAPHESCQNTAETLPSAKSSSFSPEL